MHRKLDRKICDALFKIALQIIQIAEHKLLNTGPTTKLYGKFSSDFEVHEHDNDNQNHREGNLCGPEILIRQRILTGRELPFCQYGNVIHSFCNKDCYTFQNPVE